jgi:tRNA pseudouridine55 synthase
MERSSYHGLLVLDKPGGITSRDLVDRASAWFPRGTRIGHTGTLDPLATGVLVLCVGVATRLSEYVQAQEKVYRAGVRLGRRSDTDDADGRVEEIAVERPPDRGDVERCLQLFVGTIDQVPPAYSAAHVAGQRAYRLARQGRDVSLAPRRVQIDAIEIVAYSYPELEIEVRCSKGTYIRSLARDLGKRLLCGAIVQTLRRTRVGPFTEREALSLIIDPPTAREHLRPLSAAVALPRVTLNAEAIRRVRQGQAIACPAAGIVELGPGAEVAVMDEAGTLVAITVRDGLRDVLMPTKVLLAE